MALNFWTPLYIYVLGENQRLHKDGRHDSSPKHVNHHLVAGSSIGHKHHLRVSGWDMSQFMYVYKYVSNFPYLIGN